MISDETYWSDNLGLLLCQARYFARQCKDNGAGGSLISLGRLDFFLTLDDFFDVMIETGYAHRTDQGVRFFDPQTQSDVDRIFRENRQFNPEFRHRKIIEGPVITDELFYRALGFREIYSVEISDNYGPVSYTFDLNDRDIRAVTGRGFDLVLDAGVMEHVFDVRQVMVNMGDLANVGGHIVHIMPGNNTFDHGFYQFSPTMFRDYYRANRYDIRDLSVLRIVEDPYRARPIPFSERWNSHSIWPYDPAEFSRRSFGGLGEGVYFTLACVRKGPESTAGVNPMQYLFDKPDPPLISPW